MKPLTRKIVFVILVLLPFLLAACNSSPAEEDVVAQATEPPAEVAEPTNTPEPPTATPEPPTATLAPPTNTPAPTNTLAPTNTPTPTDTPEPPTDTPTPTHTPAPTNTPTPENSPTPLPPTASPTPAVTEFFERGAAFFEQEEYDQAIVEFQQVIDLEPQLDVAYAFLGYSYAFGPEDFGKAIEALETYLELAPDAEDRAQVEEDIQLMRELLAQQADPQFDVPPGMALFAFKNYSGDDWNVDVGPYFLQVPANSPDREFTYTTLAIEPGTYAWQAHSPGGGFYLTDANGNRSFEFTVAEGEIYETQCCR